MLKDLMDSDDNFSQNLHKAWSSWQCYSSDPFRHDYVDKEDDIIDNEDYYLNELVNSVCFGMYNVQKLKDEVEDYIRDY